MFQPIRTIPAVLAVGVFLEAGALFAAETAPAPRREPLSVAAAAETRSRERVGPRAGGSLATAVAIYSAGALADLSSTEVALSRSCAAEGNPLMTRGAIRYAAKAGEVAALTYLDRRIGRRHPRGVKVLRAVVLASRVAIAVRNVTHRR